MIYDYNENYLLVCCDNKIGYQNLRNLPSGFANTHARIIKLHILLLRGNFSQCSVFAMKVVKTENRFGVLLKITLF